MYKFNFRSKCCNLFGEPKNYMITVPRDISFYILHIHNDISIITCDNRIIELINTVKRLTKNSIGLQLNELFENVFKTNI